MVLNNLHYQVGVLAKESSVLSILSGDRFELGIGAGDWPESFDAWGEPFPGAEQRLARLEETVAALRRLWTGEPVSMEGAHVRLAGAVCTPAPPSPPRVVVGVGGSRRTLASAVRYADELNLYDSPELLDGARAGLAQVDRSAGLSVYLSWEWDKWPADPADELSRWQQRGVARVLVAVGAEDMPGRIRQLAGFRR